MIRIVTFLFFIFSSHFLFAQTWQWAKYEGGTNLDYGNAIATDAMGNSYVTGYFYGNATFQIT